MYTARPIENGALAAKLISLFRLELCICYPSIIEGRLVLTGFIRELQQEMEKLGRRGYNGAPSERGVAVRTASPEAREN